MSVMDVRRLVRALGVGALVFLFLGGGVGLVAADDGDGAGETWTVAMPGPGDRATYRVDDRVVDRRAADGRYDVGLGMRLDVEWLPATEALAEDGSVRPAHPLAMTLRYEGLDPDYDSDAETAFDAATGAPLSRSVRWSGSFESQLGFGGIVSVGQATEGSYEGRRDHWLGPRGPCGFSSDLPGRTVAEGDPVQVFGGCEDDEASTVTTYTVRGWDRVDGRRLLRLESATGLDLHYDPALPVPIHVEAHMHEMWANPAFKAGRLTTLELLAFHEGSSEYPARPSLPPVAPPAPLPLAPVTPWMVQDDGVPHRFPLHAAHAAALDPATYGGDEDEETVADFLERHPRAYLGWAWGAHSEDARGTRYESWYMLWTDGQDAIAKRVVLWPAAMVAELPGPLATPFPTTTEWETDLVERAEDVFPTPGGLPASLPHVSGVWALAERALASYGLQPNTYNLAILCGDSCQQAVPTVYAGFTRFPFNSVDSQVQDQTATSFLVAADGQGRPAGSYRFDSQSQAPLPVLPAGEPVASSPASETAAAATAISWALPAPEAVAGVGLLATLLGALYYFWPAVKGGFVGLFSRIEPERVLDHPARRNLHALVEANPGIHFQELVRRTGFGRGQLEHHLRKLERAELVSRVKGDSYACFFARGQVDRRVMAAAPLLRSDGGRGILVALHQRPGASSRDLAAQLGLAVGTVSYHVKRLREAGMLESAGGALHLTETGRQATSLAA